MCNDFHTLSQGIFELEAKDCGNGMISGEQDGFPVYYHGLGRDWCKTEEKAIAIAEEMRKKKLHLSKSRSRSWRR